ncbi:hypothetical protein BS17DRAFT_816521 [Gyrodon lividus]|nr:hypothetical protein BS17DRAFT_816521 [Gyrodon lividus]
MSAPSPASVARQLMQAPLVGSFIALLLYGITSIQTFFYFQTYPDDHVYLKCMVTALWSLETIHTGLNMSFINHYLIDSFGDVEALNEIEWLCAVHAFPKVWFTTHHITGELSDRATKSWWTVSILGVLTAARFALSTTSVIFGSVLIYKSKVTSVFNLTRSGIYHDSWETFKGHAYVMMITLMGLGITGDTLAAAILSLYLQEGRSGARRTDRLINRLLAYTVATGAFTAMFDCLALIAVSFTKTVRRQDYDPRTQILASTNTILYLAFVHILMKVYANSALMSTFDKIMQNPLPFSKVLQDTDYNGRMSALQQAGAYLFAVQQRVFVLRVDESFFSATSIIESVNLEKVYSM